MYIMKLTVTILLVFGNSFAQMDFTDALLRINNIYLLDTQTVAPYFKEDENKDYWAVLAPLEILASFAEASVSYTPDCQKATVLKTTDDGTVHLELTAGSTTYLKKEFPHRTVKGSEQSNVS
jgi:hypothetical protein